MTSATYPTHRNMKSVLVIIEILIGTVVLVVMGWWLFEHAGGPLLLDELTYMKVAILRIQEVDIINRYFHIYLMMPFFQLTSNPFIGVKVFWVLLIMFTGVLTYITARFLSHAIVPALAALALYFAQVGIFHYPGVAWPDFTLMLLFAASTMLYLLLPRMKKQRSLAIALMGALFYFSMRSKETAVILSFLFIGYGFLNTERFSWRDMVKSLLFVIIGIAAAVIGMMVLDQLVLGDALWTLYGIQENMRLNFIGYIERVDYNYLLLMSDGLDTFTAMILFMVSGILLFKRFSWYERILYLFAIAQVLFLTAALLRGPGVIEARYLIPTLPLICVMATLIFKLDEPATTKQNITSGVVFVIGLFLIFIFSLLIIKLLTHYGIDKWNINNLFMSVLYPTALCLLLVVWFWTRKNHVVTFVLSLLCFAVMIFHPLEYNYRYLNIRWAAIESENRFYPFKAFAKDLGYNKEMHFFISDNLPSGNPMNQETGMLGLRADVVATMYSVYFQQNAREDQFFISNSQDFIQSFNTYDYAVFTLEDWNLISDESRNQITKKFTIQFDPLNQLVLLKR